MTLEEAMKIVDQACALFKGNRIEHVKMMEAMNVIRAELEKKLPEDQKNKQVV